MAINHKLYPDTEEQENAQSNVREEPSRDQPPRDGSPEDGSLKTVSPVANSRIINSEDSDFSALGYKNGKNVCPICGTRVPALIAKSGRNPGKGYAGEFSCTQCADFGVSDNPAFWKAG